MTNTNGQNKILQRPVSELPIRFRPVFPYVNFNRVQSLVYDTMLDTSRPVVVSAPTGSGKTGIFELAIIKVVMEAELKPVYQSVMKIVYLAPTKALCSERRLDWERKFGPLNIQCIELTSDMTSKVNFKEIKRPSILLATPEKWDSITRSWNGHKPFIQSLKLLLIDEVHLVNDGSRGATLEAVISRMKTIRSLVWPDDPDNLRFVAVSATVSNVQDIADWFSTSASKAVVHRVNPNERPVKLKTIVQGYSANKNVNEFSFDSLLNHKLAETIKTYSNEKPTLIFCATRKSTMAAASTLIKEGRFDMSFASERRQNYLKLSAQIKDKTLQETTRFGVAFHHAGLCPSDRRLIESGFLDGGVMILCCTSTLAMGVNLPAHLVIIKNTSYYDEGQFKPYTESSLVQMIGRAGRPQFDTEATAVIMTKSFCRDEIEKMLSGNLIVDSQLHKYLTEHLNSEVVLGTVTSDAIARKWIESTYLHVRLRKNPENYGLRKNSSAALKEATVASWCDTAIGQLIRHKMIKRREDGGLEPTDAGRAMARHYISLPTMITLTTLKGTETLWEMIQLVCNCSEITGDIQLRVEDKPTINALLNPKRECDQLRYSMGDKIQTKEKKAAALIQATLGNLHISENNILQESMRVLRNASRVAACLKEVAFITDSMNYSLFKSILSLDQCLKAKLWEDSIYVSKQLDRIGPILSHNLAENGMTTFELLRKANPRNIEIFTNRLPPFGSNVQQTCFGLPIYELKTYFHCLPNMEGKIQLLVEVSITNGQDLRVKSSLPPDHKCCLIVGCPMSNMLFLRRIVCDAGILARPDMTCCFGAEVERTHLPEEGTEIEAVLMSEAYVGLDVKRTVFFREPEEGFF